MLHPKLTHLFTFFALAVVLGVLLTAAPAHSQAENLLVNGDFEGGFYTAESSGVVVGNGWNPFWVTTDLDTPDQSDGIQPQFMPSNSSQATVNRRRSGVSQLWYTKGSTAFAGIYQRVAVPANTTLRLSGWTYGWSSVTADTLNISSDAAWVRQRVGIDPKGGTDPNSSDIIWSLPAQYLDNWGELHVEATSQGDHVTVFLSAYPNMKRAHNDIYFDDVLLTAVAFALPTPGPELGNTAGTGGAGGSVGGGLSGSGGVAPAAIATVDPLLLGLIVAQGMAPGTQGIHISAATQPMSAAAPDTSTTPLAGTVLILIAICGAGGYWLYTQQYKQEETKS